MSDTSTTALSQQVQTDIRSTKAFSDAAALITKHSDILEDLVKAMQGAYKELAPMKADIDEAEKKAYSDDSDHNFIRLNSSYGSEQATQRDGPARKDRDSAREKFHAAVFHREELYKTLRRESDEMNGTCSTWSL